MNTADPPARGPGRPKTRPAELVRLRCDVTPAEREVIGRACAAAGVSVAAFLRAAGLEKALESLGKAGAKKSR